MSAFNSRFQSDSNQLAATQGEPEQTAGHDRILAQNCWQDLGDSQNRNGIGCLQLNTGNGRHDSSDPGLTNFDTGNNRIQITGGGNDALPYWKQIGHGETRSDLDPESENSNVHVATDGSNQVTVRDAQGMWNELPKDADLHTVKVNADSVEYYRTDRTKVTLNTQDGSEVTEVGGTKIHRDHPGAQPDRYETANGAVLEKRGDKWWVKDKDDTDWTSAGGEIVTYTNGTVKYDGTGLCFSQDYNLGEWRASWNRNSGSFGVRLSDGKVVYSKQKS